MEKGTDWASVIYDYTYLTKACGKTVRCTAMAAYVNAATNSMKASLQITKYLAKEE